MDLRPHIENFSRRFAEVEAALSDPRVFDNNQRAQELSREYARLKELVAFGNAYTKTVAHLEENRALLQTEPADSELALLAKEEIARLEAEEKRLALEIQRGVLPPDPTDSRNTIFEIRAGAGGSESALFAADLYRMYTRYAESHGWKVEPLDSSPVRPRRLQGNYFQRHRHGCLQTAQIRERRAPRPARARDRGAGPHPHQHLHRRRAAGSRGSGRRNQAPKI